MAFSSTRSGRVYGWTVVGIGLLLVSESLLRLYWSPVEPQWFLLALLTLISGSASVYLPWAHVSISVSEAFTFTAVLLYGPEAGTLTVALDGLVLSFWVAKRRPEAARALFNIAAATTSAWCSAQLFFKISGVAPLSGTTAATGPALDQLLPALLVFAIAWFLLNSWLIAFIIAFEKKQNPWGIWRHGFIWLSLNYFCGASVAVLLIGYNRTIDLRFVGVIVPLLLVLYFTFKTSTDRVADANKHVEQLNSLYLSTIETLAMAIDAKDQITHGHIRRVQTYAVGLAQKVGVKDPLLIKAIEAAALLHDMGKLAVPEYILNKPGKLSAVEFEKMKLHAAVGADILSAIAFPYPVVPIVRHHHENWDGTGYPTGIKGTDIPIGARILSVVDCFDALTSDRPYRPKLSDQEAIAILLARRGSMYDPLIVDTFIRVCKEIAPDTPTSIEASEPQEGILNSVHNAQQPAHSPLDNIAASSDEMLTMFEMASGLAGQSSAADSVDVIAKHLKRLVPFSLCVFFQYSTGSDELEARFAVGEASPHALGLRIGVGQRLSGWVAANRQTIVNSDPVLDLGDLARTPAARLRSCLSTPVVAEGDLVGVLSLYSATAEAYSEDHKRIVEDVARRNAISLSRGDETQSAKADTQEVASFKHLEDLLASRKTPSGVFPAVVFVDAHGIEDVDTAYGRDASNLAKSDVQQRIRAALRANDDLFSFRSHQFIAFLPLADETAATAVAERILHNVTGRPFDLKSGRSVQVSAVVTVISSSGDRKSLKALIDAPSLGTQVRLSGAPAVH